MSSDKCIFEIDELLKTLSQADIWEVSKVKPTKEASILCESEYKQSLLSCQKPHKPVSAETIWNWIQKALMQGGINVDINLVPSYHTRTASIDKAVNTPKKNNYGCFIKLIVIEELSLCPVDWNAGNKDLKACRFLTLKSVITLF